MRRTGTDSHMTAAFHPQADGRSERTNCTVGQMLCTFTAKRQGKWLESLDAVKFAINTASKVSTGTSPFELIFGCVPRLFHGSNNLGDPPLLGKWIDIRDNTWVTSSDSLWSSQVQQALHHNKSYRASDPLLTGSLALLNSSDWRGRHTGGVNKLRERFEDPYRAVQSFDHGQNVGLELPLGDKQHPIFHILKVKPFVKHMDLEVQGAVADSQK